MRCFLSWCAAAAAPASIALFLTLACQGPVHSSAIYYNTSKGDGTYTDEYPRRYEGFGGRVGYCAFGGSRDDPWKVLNYDAASMDPAEQILTEIDVITRGREAVTDPNGKDIFESYGLGFPYFEVSAENGNPDDGTWPYFYVKDVVGRCTSTLDFYAVSACADYQPDGAQDEFLLMQDGLNVTSGTPLSFTKRDARFDEGGVEKFRITEELFNLFNVTWDEDNQKAVLVGRPVETPEQHQALARLDGAAILMKMECEVTPLPFFPDTSDSDKLWKKVPAVLPDGFPKTTTVEHCMHFTLDITSVHPVESTDKFWCQAIDFTGDEYVAIPSDILLDVIPDSDLGMKDIVNLSPLAAFDEFNGTENARGGFGVPPIYSPNYACSRPPIGAGPQWPNNGCICFEPENAGEVSYYDMIDAEDSLPSSSFGYRTAVNTSVTSGVTVAAWVKLGDTSGPPWNYTGPTGEKSGQQTSLIFTRGQLASYGMGYNLGVGKDNGFRFEVVVKGCPFYMNGATCVNDCNESDTDTTYDGSYECCKTNLCMGTPGGIGPQRLTLESDVSLYCDDSNPYCDDYIANWHYIVGTYDAELGRASFYVDNKLVKAKDVNLAFTKRYHRDIKWGIDGLASVTRVGNGYDSVSKNFFGCTAGISVIAGASRPFPEACVIISTCAELQDLLDLSARTGDKAKICSSTTPIDCRATSQSGPSSIVLEEGIASAKCVSQDLAEERCVLDLSPVAEGYSYNSILLKQGSILIMEGFELVGVSDNTDVVEFGASSAMLHIVDQCRTLCPEKNGKRPVSCLQSLNDVEIKVFDRAEMQDFDKKDADVYFGEAPDCLSTVDAGQSLSIAFGSGSYVAVARSVHDGEDIFASEFFDQDAGEVDFKFMLHVNKGCDKERRFGASTLKSNGKKKRRQLEDQVCEDLTIVYPQYSIWNSTTEVYPMNVVSNSSCTVDVCAIVPQGYAFMAVLDENDIELPINGDCVHTLSGGEHVLLLFQLQSNVDAEPDVAFDVEMDTAGTTEQRFLRNLKRRQRIEIKGYHKSTKGSAQKELRDKLKRKGGGKGKLLN